MKYITFYFIFSAILAICISAQGHTVNVGFDDLRKLTAKTKFKLAKHQPRNATEIPSNSTSFHEEISRVLNKLKRWKNQHQELAAKVPFEEDKVKVDFQLKRKSVLRFLGSRRKRSQNEDENGFGEDIMRLIEDNFPCRDPKTLALIRSGTTYFNQPECSQCTCYMAKLTCKKNLKKCHPHACHLRDREIIQNFAIHNDGCNNCLCYFGELICTHLRCPEAGHHYTNYKSMGLDDVDPENNLDQPAGSESATRKPDSCLECDHLTGSSVCGLKQWKTYPTLCHAMFCGKNRDEDVDDRSCELLDPCVPTPCMEDEDCVPYYQSSCIANEYNSLCQQFKCISTDTECSTDDMTDAVCGEDGLSYENECKMLRKGVKFAYKGKCKKNCKSEVCGIESRTYASRCHANEMNAHVDYNGCCEYHFKSSLMKDNERGSSFDDERCEMVYENGRCPPVKCEKTVLPPGACCPICGLALVISVNIKTLVNSSHRLQQIYTFLTGSEIPAHLCKISVDLTYSMDILVVVQPYKTHHLQSCNDLALQIADRINFERKEGETGVFAKLGAATFIKEKAVEQIDTSGIENMIQ